MKIESAAEMLDPFTYIAQSYTAMQALDPSDIKANTVIDDDQA